MGSHLSSHSKVEKTIVIYLFLQFYILKGCKKKSMLKNKVELLFAHWIRNWWLISRWMVAAKSSTLKDLKQKAPQIYFIYSHKLISRTWELKVVYCHNSLELLAYLDICNQEILSYWTSLYQVLDIALNKVVV